MQDGEFTSLIVIMMVLSVSARDDTHLLQTADTTLILQSVCVSCKGGYDCECEYV